MSQQTSQMSFWDHLEALRGTLIRSLLAVFVMTCVGLCFRNFLFEKVILLPADGLKIVNLEISGQFMVHLRCSMLAGVVLAFPYILWELWLFIAPALYPHEKSKAGKAFCVGTLLFYAGVAVGYFILLPVCLRFFREYTVSGSVTNTFSLQSYISMFVSLVIVMGLVFELPMLIALLKSLGIVDRKTLREGRKYAIVAVLILAAFITPADLASMLIVSVPLYALYELGIIL